MILKKELVVLLLIGLLILLPGCSLFNQDYDLVVEDNILKINLKGYRMSCTSETVVSIYQNDSWRAVNNYRPSGPPGHFFDDEYYEPNMGCDIIGCYEIETPIKIELVEYAQIGEKDSPIFEGRQVPIISSKKLTGKIKVEFDYYIFSGCKGKKTFSEIIDN